MGFINKKQDTSVIRAKLTDKGRELLSQGKLTYDYWVCGDSEIDYNFQLNAGDNLGDFMILSPKDKINEIKNPIPAYVGGDIYNSLGEVVSIEKVVNKAQPSRGFFNGNTINNDLFKGRALTKTNGLGGGSSLTLTGIVGTIEVGDLLVIGLRNPVQTNGTLGTIPANVTPFLTYRITAINGSIYTLDRNLPNFNTGDVNCPVYCIEGNDPINNFYSEMENQYWDYDNLSFQDNNGDVANDVKIWNFNIVHTENLVGLNSEDYKDINEYGGRFYSGIKTYLNSDKKALGIIHFSNNMTTNVYGESFTRGTFKATLPTVMYHKGASNGMGITLMAQTVEGESYDNLIVNGLTTDVVGRVYNDLKIAIIDDEEILAAMSYGSNRSWTLPKLEGIYLPPTSGTGLIDSTKDLYATYLFENSGEGFKATLPCQNYTRVENVGVNTNDVRFNFPQNSLPYLKSTYEVNGGFTANKIHLLVQLVDKGERPSQNGWKRIEITSNMGGNGTTNLTQAGIQTKTTVVTKSLYDSAPIFNLADYIQLPEILSTDKLLFGEENVLLGNVEVTVEAKIFKSSFIFPLLFNQFKESTNPTYIEAGQPLYISEVGVYTEDKELVMLGKLSNPILKEVGGTIILQLEIDF